MTSQLLFAFLASLYPVLILATCTNPQVSVTSFSTQDATIINQIAIIGEFTVKCSNKESPPLFAEYEGKLTPIARVGENVYQLSWSEDIKKVRSGDFNVRLFDEEGYSNIRKAQRSGDDMSSVKPLAEVAVNHAGSYKGPWVNSELLAGIVALIASYFALTTKSKLLS